MDGNFYPLNKSDVLNQPGSKLPSYIVDDNRRSDYVADILLRVVLLTYMKHVKNIDAIGWEALSDELHTAICEAIGDDEFCKWNDTTSNA